MADIESHELVRSNMNEAAYHVISRASGTPYVSMVAYKQKDINDRWRALCQQLGITYKKAEETKYGLKLLEIQLKQLNNWMAEVEGRLSTFAIQGCSELHELQKKLAAIKVSHDLCFFCLLTFMTVVTVCVCGLSELRVPKVVFVCSCVYTALFFL